VTEAPFSQTSFNLLEDLRANNTKAWYADNRAAFKDHLLQPFEDMLVATSKRLKTREFAMSGGAQTMFRQNRDARFNKGPDAYHRYVSGMLSPSGTKLASHGVIYARLTNTGGFLSVGFHDLSTQQLNKMRDHILQNPSKFKAIIADLHDAGITFPEDMDPFDLPSLTLATMPRGYADHNWPPSSAAKALPSLKPRLGRFGSTTRSQSASPKFTL
jgi:uncharacterized protein (TIGR02453 family)